MNVLLLRRWLADHRATLSGARLRELRQVDAKSIALRFEEATDDVRARPPSHWLLVSILEAYPVVALLPDDSPLPHRDLPEGNFALAAGRHLVGATLDAIEQDGFDRSVCFEFAQRDIYGRESRKTLRAELVGRASNAYLISERGMVVSMLKRVPPGRNTVRRVITGKPLPPPPPLGKYIAAEAGVDTLAVELDAVREGTESGGDPIRELLTRRVAGGDVYLWPRLQPLLPPATTPEALHAFAAALQAGELDRELFELDGCSANDVALEHWHAAQDDPAGAAGARPPSRAQDQAQHRRAQLEQQLELARQAESLETLAQELQREADALSSRGAEAALLQQWTAAHPQWAERVDPAVSLRDNSSALIQYARRLQRARPHLETLLADGTQEAKVVGADLASAREGPESPTAPAPDPLTSDLRRLTKGDVKYLRFVSSDGVHMLVGQTDRSNDELVRMYGSSRHLWLHVRDFPGSHVVLLTGGREPSHRTLQEAAVVAGYFSQGRTEGEVEVSYLPLKHLRRPKGGRPGQVLKTSEKVIRVRPEAFEELRAKLQYG